MGTQFHEHQADILRWSWRVFCRKWERLIEQVARERWRRARAKQQRSDEAAFNELRAAAGQQDW